MNMYPSTWLWEFPTPNEAIGRAVDQIILKKRTRFQELVLADTPQYGRMLVLDGLCQSSTSDEFLYHEPLVQLPMIIHGAPRSVLILGGGEGATAREALRWRTVEKVVMVDIDGEVVDACKKYMPELHQGAFDDPRTELIIDDALRYVRRAKTKFDVIVSDLTDPSEGGPASKLYGASFYRLVKRVLAPDGVFVTHTGLVAPTVTEGMRKVWAGLGSVFKYRLPYTSYVPSFLCMMGFVMASERNITAVPSADAMDKIIKTNINGSLRMLDGAVAHALLTVPCYLRDILHASSKHK